MCSSQEVSIFHLSRPRMVHPHVIPIPAEPKTYSAANAFDTKAMDKQKQKQTDAEFGLDSEVIASENDGYSVAAGK
ncbi:hypothetical protein LOK49_LG08G01179 [Camellia lanceoleosa]|uniref:Uncharacterized protein n=1 Tax=Camellia lanceoleosa TaxID=1840588 RepID=A0ACC0GSE3_9ERIC|nr:hypothetical protein LOK49_LG08G01179 [Camellia lanceoleosa]